MFQVTSRFSRSLTLPLAFGLGLAALECLVAQQQCLVAQQPTNDGKPHGQTSRPNIVLLMGDDHGWDETSYYDHPYVKTPVLDEMVEQGLRLDRFYAAHPSCSPTRASVLTGRHPIRSGTFAPNWSLRPAEVTIAHHLAEAGYRCGHFGKWHVGPVKADSPTNPGAMGFDAWLSHDNFFELDPVLSRNGETPEKFPGESSAILVDEAVRFIDETASNNRPFFVVIWFGSPHEPYAGLPEDLQRYRHVANEYPDQQVRLTSLATGQQTTRPLGEVLQARYAEITAMDRAIGTLRQHLQEQSLRENTLLWYCGDNGSPRGASTTTPLRGQKGQMFEGGIRVPGIIEWPTRVSAGRTTDYLSVTSDMLPTLCELAGIEPPQRTLDGISLRGLIDGEVSERTEPVCFWSYSSSQIRGQPTIPADQQSGTTPLVKKLGGKFTRNFRNLTPDEIRNGDYAGERVIMTQRYKLLIRGSADETATTPELFDLVNDPAEQQNLAAQQKPKVNDLAAQLRRWQTSVLRSLCGKQAETE